MKFSSLIVASLVCVLVAAMSAQAAGATKVIKFVAVQVSQKQPTKSSFVIRDNDFSGGKKIGHDTLSCVAISQTKGNCIAVFVMNSGTIRTKFVISFAGSAGRGTITGGTGAYAGAKGTLAYKNLNSDGTRTAITLTLT